MSSPGFVHLLSFFFLVYFWEYVCVLLYRYPLHVNFCVNWVVGLSWLGLRVDSCVMRKMNQKGLILFRAYFLFHSLLLPM